MTVEGEGVKGWLVGFLVEGVGGGYQGGFSCRVEAYCETEHDSCYCYDDKIIKVHADWIG